MPKPQSTMPVAMADSASVMRTGASRGADGSTATIRSTSDEANIPVIAAVDVSDAADRERQ